jgi:hypothetical protein
MIPGSSTGPRSSTPAGERRGICVLGRDPARARKGSGWTRHSAVGCLLEALGGALARDQGSIPGPVQRAALNLARQIQMDRRRPATANPGHGRNGRLTVHPDTGWGAVRGEAVPFATSIRLGRMG